MVTGLDLVELQLRIAAGGTLADWVPERPVVSRGHAIEVRLYAEDPERDFLPGSGRLEMLRLPSPSAQVRLDSGVVEGDVVSVYYDPMIAKLIVHGSDRADALARMRLALAQSVIVGPKSNVDFLERLTRHPAVIEASIDTSYLDQHLAEVMVVADTVPDEVLAAVAARALIDEEAQTLALAQTGSDPHSPWARADGWRIGHAGKRLKHLKYRDQTIEVAAHGSGGNYQLDSSAVQLDVRAARCQGDEVDLLLGKRSVRMRVIALGNGYLAHDGNRRWLFELRHPFAFEASKGVAGNAIRAPMPGRIVAVKIDADSQVSDGQEVIVMEAMKMEITLRAPRAGQIAELRASVGEFVEADAVLVRLA
jgi:3-methylcrotonyl-CoA carboxylase alpha subunit